MRTPVRYNDTQIQIYEQETPMIQKNKQFRKQKRSSIGLRGKRVSTSLNNLCPSPHTSVPPSSYYTLIDNESSDPMRMRQLLLWCCLKTSESFPSKSYQSGSDDIIRAVQQQVLEGLTSKEVNTSWYSRVDEPSMNLGEHPMNLENAKKIKEFEAKMAQYFILIRYKGERQEWHDILEFHRQDSVKNSESETIVFQPQDVIQYLDSEHMELLKKLATINLKVDDFVENIGTTSMIEVV